MNIAFEHETRLTGHASGRDSEEFIPARRPFDWLALRSRLFAAHDLRAILDADPGPARLHARGSFAGPAANVIHTYGESSGSVNPNALTNRKPTTYNLASVAGGRSAGARG